ncbi:MAG: HipA domain-containing protein [Lachnospiraceae bacterium]|nr:HipA domain-containing protein [Lachnospiraceae bacterium]
MEKYFDFSDCPQGHKRYGGSDEKKTIYFNGERYMLKFPDKVPDDKRNELNSSYRNNIFSEYVSCHIIETLDIPVQSTILGVYKDRVVVACKDFCTDGYQLNEFQEYNSSNDGRFKEVHYPEIDNVVEAIGDYEKSLQEKATERFWDTFAIDTLLGNFDRHTGNWGYLYNDDAISDKIKLAPIYDCGSCLYPMLADKGIEQLLSDRSMIDERLYSYPKAAFSFEGKQISYHDFLLSDRVLKDPCACKSIKKIYERFDKEKVEKIIEDTPLISDLRRELYKTMIDERMEHLILPNIKQQEKLYQINITDNISSISSIKDMESSWNKFMTLPKEDKKSGIEWGGKKIRISEFDDIYISKCQRENVEPNKKISEHFWKNCVDIQGYEPKYCSLKDHTI